jgi:hypothetical protein
MIQDLIASGRVAEIAIALICLEAIVLLMFLRRRGRGHQVAPTLAGLAAGAALFLALRASLMETPGIALFLAAALLAHATELALRLRQS